MTNSVSVVSSKFSNKSNETFVLMLPGAILDVSHLVNIKKKFRNRDGRSGALDAMKKLEEDGLGKLVLKKHKGQVKVSFSKYHNTIDSININRHGNFTKLKFLQIKMKRRNCRRSWQSTIYPC